MFLLSLPVDLFSLLAFSLTSTFTLTPFSLRLRFLRISCMSLRASLARELFPVFCVGRLIFPKTLGPLSFSFLVSICSEDSSFSSFTGSSFLGAFTSSTTFSVFSALVDSAGFTGSASTAFSASCWGFGASGSATFFSALGFFLPAFRSILPTTFKGDFFSSSTGAGFSSLTVVGSSGSISGVGFSSLATGAGSSTGAEGAGALEMGADGVGRAGFCSLSLSASSFIALSAENSFKHSEYISSVILVVGRA